MAYRDEYTDSSRDGNGQQQLKDCGDPIDNTIKTLMDEKRAYRGIGPTAGTRGAGDIAASENG